MSKAPQRELRVMVNEGKQQVSVILLADGSPLGDIVFTQEQAEQHARTVIDAIERLQGSRKTGLILPGEFPASKPN